MIGQSNRALAGLSLLFNLPFALFQLHRAAFDTYSHIFFADHYRRAWFSLWEPRWYLGFSVASYPPLVHQVIALISWPIEAAIRFFALAAEPYPGAFAYAALETAFVLTLLGVLALLPVAVRAFARIFVGPAAAARAGLLAVAVPAVSLSAWAFGQLPTLFGTVALLLAFARGASFARAGRPLHLAQAVALAAVAGAAHHGVFLLVPFMGAAVVWRLVAMHLALSWRRPFVLAAGGGRRLAGRVLAARILIWMLCSGLAVAAVLWPFLAWTIGQDIQTPIDHGSRHNLFAELGPAWFFFIPMYGPLLLAAPWAVRDGLRQRRRLLPLLALVLMLFVLGLGGSTGLPRIIFGDGWAWLTYDRFALWAAVSLLPFAALATLPRRRLGPARARQPRRVSRLRPVLLLFAGLLSWSAMSAWHSVITHSQPPRLDLGPVIAFLIQPERWRERYLTLGFGDQMARLSALVPNGTPDGNYHTARWLPEQRASGLGALDGAVWNPQGVNAARPFLAQPARYGVRWALVMHRDYIPILRATGWQFRWYTGAVSVWEHPDGVTRALRRPGWAEGPAASWWGTAPLAALVLAVTLQTAGRNGVRLRRPRREQATGVLAAARWAATALALILLALWWVHVVWQGQIQHVFFLYQSSAVFACDLAALVAVGLWLLERGARRERLRVGPPAIAWSGLTLIGAVAISVAFSDSQRQSVFVAAHLVLVGAWYLMFVNDPPVPGQLGKVLAVLLGVQALAAVGQALAQTNAWLQPLNVPWPPLFDTQVSGASVVQNSAGERWLRAYGTLPHPNVLGGFLLAFCGAMVERFLVTGRRPWLALLAAGAGAMVLTFSRAAWLGAALAAVAGAVVWLSRRPSGGAVRGGMRGMLHLARSAYLDDRRRQELFQRAWHAQSMRVALVSVAAVLVAAGPLLPWLLVRTEVGAAAPRTEVRSLDERARLTRNALVLIAAHPIFGVGAGRFVPVTAQLQLPANAFEPVHNIPLLVTAEAGVLGVAAIAALAVAIGMRFWRRRRTAPTGEIVWGVTLAGLLAIGLFDHYWWTLPPARLLLATVLGLWAGYSVRKPCSLR